MAKRKAIVDGVDVPIVSLTPIRKRKVRPKDFRKLKANLAAVGLIEPLCVCREEDTYYILDGYLRYQAFLELGVETVPCLVLESRDIYTPNRQVNSLSHKQEKRMLRKALETLDEKTVAAAFGMESIARRVETEFGKEIHPDVMEMLKSDRITKLAARELTYVTHQRQREILKLIEKSGDASPAFVKTQVLKTPAAQRTKRKNRANPWTAAVRNKRDLVKKLTEVEDQYDFYSTIYRQYVADLLKLAIYVRQIVTRPKLREHLAEHHPEALDIFDKVLAESEGKAAG